MKFPAYKGQIAGYLVSGISQKTGGRIDFDRIWARQAVSREMERLIEAWAPQIDTILRQSAGQKNPSEWFKKEDCWIQAKLPALSDPLPPELSHQTGTSQGSSPSIPAGDARLQTASRSNNACRSGAQRGWKSPSSG